MTLLKEAAMSVLSEEKLTFYLDRVITLSSEIVWHLLSV